jgi:hypothetical protein
LRKGPQIEHAPEVREKKHTRRLGKQCIGNKEKQHEEEERQRQKEGQHDEEKIGSWNSCMQEVVMWKNLIHLGLGFSS